MVAKQLKRLPIIGIAGVSVIQFIYESDRALFENAISFAQAQVKKLIEKYPDFYPMYTEGGRWQHEGAAWTHWCDGFLPGMMWIFHKHLGADKPEAKFWLEQAIRYTKPLENRKMDRDVHDLGFIFFSTYHRWYQATRETCRPRGSDAGRANHGAALQ